MSGPLLILLLLFAGGALAADKPKLTAKRSTLRDQPRFSCLVSSFRRLSAECEDNQLVCYYTRRMPRFASDFRPNDLIGRGCDVRRNREPGSCQEYSKGLDTFVRCECGTADCNSHYWHGFAVAALHHQKAIRERKAAAAEGLNVTAGGTEPATYASWFMTCFWWYCALWAYYIVRNVIKKYHFQKHAVLMRAVLVARGTQQADELNWNLIKPEWTIHNFKTSLIKLLDGFIRYRSLGSLPPVDINQLRATWLLGKQDLIRLPAWFKSRGGANRRKLEKQAEVYNIELIDVPRCGLEKCFMDETIFNELTLLMRQKEQDKKTKKEQIVVTDKASTKGSTDNEAEDRSEGDRSSRKSDKNDTIHAHPKFII